MRYQIFGRYQNSGKPVEPFFLDAQDEEDARNLASEQGTIVERVQLQRQTEEDESKLHSDPLIPPTEVRQECLTNRKTLSLGGVDKGLLFVQGGVGLTFVSFIIIPLIREISWKPVLTSGLLVLANALSFVGSVFA